MRSGVFTVKRAAVVAAVAVAMAAPAGARAAGGGGTRIVGGQQSAEAEYPFVASLQFPEGSSGIERHFCGGSLIDREWVLTAAHCVAGTSPGDFDVVVGRSELTSTSGMTRHVAEVVVHPGYGSAEEESPGPDVALVRLSAPVEGIEPVEPVRTDERRLWEPGDRAEVVGWGLTSEAGDLSDDLRAVTVEIQADDVMSSPAVYGHAFMAEHMLGAGPIEGGQDSCQGDSGGPLFVRSGTHARQVGIVSWGEGCAREGKPGIYTRLGEGPTRDFVDSLIPLRVEDLSVFEGGTAHLTVTLPRPSTLPVEVEYALMSGTATADRDFVAAAGRIQIPAGATSGSIPVRILGDREAEADESFRVAVASATNPSLTRYFARVTIVDDDGPPAGTITR